MSFDISRNIFDPRKNYQGVVVEQGRVQSDADWNDWLATSLRRIQAGTLDTFGGSVVPATTPFGFQVTAVSSGGNSISIGVGRMYVDGILAENHGLAANAVWDSALAEMSGSPVPPPSTASTIDYLQQPYYPNPDVSLLAGNGPLLAYIDVWTRPVNFLQDPNLVDAAIAVDTAGRLQTIWQVRLMPATGSSGGGSITCATPDANVFPKPSAGRLATGTVPNATSGPCCLTDASGYTGVENQFYRVEIQNGGVGSDTAAASGATFKWSRENGSVQTSVISIDPGTNTLNMPASVLSVTSLGRDQVLGFLPGNWIELTNEAMQLNGMPGELYQIDQVDAPSRTITLTGNTSAKFPAGVALDAAQCTRIIRWDQSGKVYEEDLSTVWWDLDVPGSKGAIPVPASGTTLVLESGITVVFSVDASSSANGQFGACDFWSFTARTATAQVEVLDKAPPLGPHHHYAKLSVVSFDPPSNPDCRTPWPSGATSCGCCAVTVGTDGAGQYASIQAAINALPADGGEVMILAGRYFENVVIANRRDITVSGCGVLTRLASSASATGAAAASGTGETGMAAVITVINSQHIELRSFCVEAAADEVGVLLDRPGSKSTQGRTNSGGVGMMSEADSLRRTNTDVGVVYLDVVASTRPAIGAFAVVALTIERCRIAMADVRSKWPGIYVAGREVRIERNWVGIAGTANAKVWMPASIVGDASAAGRIAQAAIQANPHSGPPADGLAANTLGEVANPLTKVVEAPGGIQIAGGSVDVLVVDNEVEGGRHNGITLGSTSLLDRFGNVITTNPGVTIETPDPCITTGSLELPKSVGGGADNLSVIPGPGLRNIQIERNRIRGMGLCGIGPVGFFDLSDYAEIVTIENLSILGNRIEATVRLELPPPKPEFTDIGYGAICLPDVKSLRILDNVITDFGSTPGAPMACGIFVLHAECATLSRNQVQETRDWQRTFPESSNAGKLVRGGIVIRLVTPTSFASNQFETALSHKSFATVNDTGLTKLAAPVFEPTIPALIVEGNTVRATLGPALHAVGFGPFSIVGNNVASGGTVSLSTSEPDPALTVEIINLGVSLELATLFGLFSDLYGESGANVTGRASASTAASSDGNVLFANNACKLLTRANERRGHTSVLVASLDHVLFNNNRCWVDGDQPLVIFDVCVLAVSVQFCGNHLQEVLGSIFVSGLTFGLLNVTSQNLTTFCLLALGPWKLVSSLNVDWMPAGVCDALSEQLRLGR